MKNRIKLLVLLACAAFSNLAIANETIFSVEEASASFDFKEVDKKPQPIRQDQPEVTPDLRNEKGRVYVAFIVSEEGRVTGLRCVQSTSDKLTPVVLRAVEQWRFHPGMHQGAKVAVRVLIPIRVDFS
jgi:TonB family protein